MRWNRPRTKMKRRVAIGLVILLVISGLAVVYANVNLKGGSHGSPDVVATVEGQKITRDELTDLLLEQAGQQGLSILIAEKLIELEAEKQEVVVSEEEIEEELTDYYEYYGGKEGFTQALEMTSYSADEVRKNLVQDLTIKKLLASRTSVSEEEIKEYFEENKERLAEEEQVRASHILVETEEEAQTILEKLEQGEDFAELAGEFSMDTATKEYGGDLGFFTRAAVAQEFAEAAFALSEGENSEPVKTVDGYHIIKTMEKKAAKAADYEENKEKIADLLVEEKMQEEYTPWIQELTQQYKIENFLAEA